IATGVTGPFRGQAKSIQTGICFREKMNGESRVEVTSAVFEHAEGDVKVFRESVRAGWPEATEIPGLGAAALAIYDCPGRTAVEMLTSDGKWRIQVARAKDLASCKATLLKLADAVKSP